MSDCSACASSGRISGSGLASARISGSRAMRLTMSGVSTLGPDSPRKMSASTMGSARVRALTVHAERAVRSPPLEPVHHAPPGDDRRAVLVIVEHGDLHPLAQLPLDVEAIGRLDVLE